jgi:hypothetical protein
MWLMMNGGLLLLVSTMDVALTPQLVGAFVLLSASITLVTLALGLRLAIWPSMSKRMLVLWLSWMLLIPPIVVPWMTRETWGYAPFLILAGVLLAIGATLLNHARKVWLDLELG